MSKLDIMSNGNVVTRHVHEFDIPSNLHKFGVTKIGLVELTAEEEIMASKRSQNNLLRAASEQAKMSLRMVNDKKVSVAGTGEDSADSVFDKMHPKIRQLVVIAYSSIHSVEDADATNFLATHQIRVG